MVGIAELGEFPGLDAKESVLLDFARRLSRSPAEIRRGDWDALLEAGWTHQQAVEAVHIVGLFEYVNRVADGFGMESHGSHHPHLLEHLHTRPDPA